MGGNAPGSESTWPGYPWPPAGGYPSYPAGAPGYAPPQGGAGAAFKWGLIFGAVAGALNLLQVVAGAGAVAANQASIDAYESGSDFAAYLDCARSGSPASTCSPPPAPAGIGIVLSAFYGSCLLAFVLTLVVYLFAGRAAARATGRRGPGVGAAVIAAVAGSLLYFVFSLAAVTLTGRSGLLFGLGPLPVTGIDSGTWEGILVAYVAIADVIGAVLAVGLAALMGLWGAALGARHAQPAIGAMPYPPAYSGHPGYPGYPSGPPLPQS